MALAWVQNRNAITNCTGMVPPGPGQSNGNLAVTVNSLSGDVAIKMLLST